MDFLKTCTKCKRNKPLDEFAKSKRFKDGHSHWCKECAKESARKWREANPDRVKEQGKKRREMTSPEKRKEIDRRYATTRAVWKKANPKKLRAYRAKYRQSNPDKAQESSDRWRKANRVKVRVYENKWKSDNPDKVYNSIKRWRKQNPERVRANDIARRARVANSEGRYTQEEWVKLVEYYGNKCLCCGIDGANSRYGKLTVDHVIPLHLEGRNDISNLQPLCHNCNAKKQTRIIDYRPSVPDWVKQGINYAP
jgi:hypothetical protein